MTIRSLLILPVLLSAVCYAQEPEPRARRRAPDREPPLVSMTFRGGTMARFVAEIRKAEPKCNIVVADAAAGAELPPMEVQDAGLDQVLDSACAVATSKMRIACQEQRGRGVPVFAILALPPRQASGASVATTGFAKRDEVTTMVLSLNRLTGGAPQHAIEGFKVETILSALETGSRFDEKAPLMRYHEDSGLLFLRGTHQQLSLAADVLKILERDMKTVARPRASRGAGGNSQPSEPAFPSGSTKKRRAR